MWASMLATIVRSPHHGLWAVELRKTLKTEKTAQLNWVFLKKVLGQLSQKKNKKKKENKLGLWKKG